MSLSMVTIPGKGREEGKLLRKLVPRSSHDNWTPAANRRSPVEMIFGQDSERLEGLVPYRHQRMSESPFAFFRGAARIMAADLANTPVSGLMVQICGDAHLSNFGLFGSPERDLVFDLNDFDETLTGPWEWDLKRLAASFVIASRHNSFNDKKADDVVKVAVRYYSETMAELATLPAIDIRYSHVRAEDIPSFLSKSLGLTPSEAKKLEKNQEKLFKKARTRDSYQALSKLAVKVDGHYRFISEPPFVVPLSDLRSDLHPDHLREIVQIAFEGYRASLPDSRRHLLDRYELVHVALKVVGVGSVGTRCFVVLFEGRGVGDPLILQVKEAGTSVLAEFLEPSIYDNQGQRVVEGQRLMQSVSDIFLGWTRIPTLTGSYRDFYWRQLRDMKFSAPIEQYVPLQMDAYARLCGLTLAYAHARTGDPAAIAGYVGSGSVFTEAIAQFAHTYADQNEQDFQEFVAAAEGGRLIFDSSDSVD
jgi:uncharacterized protein (DUF2252 family)